MKIGTDFGALTTNRPMAGSFTTVEYSNSVTQGYGLSDYWWWSTVDYN